MMMDEFTGVDAASRIDLASIEAAAQRIAPHIVTTPLLESPRLNEWLGFRLLIKPENLQHTGSFKLRGASNAIWSLDNTVKKVFAYSSGNHAQGVARAATSRGLHATILMPEDSPKVKIAGTRAFGGTVVTYDRYTENREEIGEQMATETGAVLIRPYEDTRIIAGQGTVGLEIATQCAAMGVTPDHLVCCCGGGGLIAGISTALRAKMPTTQIWAAEPANYDDTIRSLASGRREHADTSQHSVCDAIVTPQPGEMTFSINRQTLAGGFAIEDSLVLQSMAAAFHHLKLVVEPGGAVALAAALDRRLPEDATCVVSVISGGNVDADVFERALAGTPLL
jgi:threonine dehydratase